MIQSSRARTAVPVLTSATAKENTKREAKMEEKLNAKRDKQLSKAQGKRKGTGADAVGGGGSSADAVDDNS